MQDKTEIACQIACFDALRCFYLTLSITVIKFYAWCRPYQCGTHVQTPWVIEFQNPWGFLLSEALV